VTSYRGNYEKFIVQKQEERTRREKEILKREREIEVHKEFIRRFKAKASKARQANSRVKRMEKIEIEELPQSSRRYPLFKIEKKRASGKKILDIRNITKSYNDNVVLHDISFTIGRDEKVAIIGPNGIGKSTLLKILMDEVEADHGSVEWGHEAHLGYFAQDHKAGLGNQSSDVLSSFWESCPLEPIGACYGKLAEVLFSREETTKKIKNLSGGEAARLLLSKIAAKKPNVLILDEPTNHLDLESIASLAETLCNYTASIIFVSHDRWLVSQVATRIIEITEDGVESYMGTYPEFMHYKERKV
jgi:ATPase subunit of ABC transporter with duplicated ATPase domains